MENCPFSLTRLLYLSGLGGEAALCSSWAQESNSFSIFNGRYLVPTGRGFSPRTQVQGTDGLRFLSDLSKPLDQATSSPATNYILPARQ